LSEANLEIDGATTKIKSFITGSNTTINEDASITINVNKYKEDECIKTYTNSEATIDSDGTIDGIIIIHNCDGTIMSTKSLSADNDSFAQRSSIEIKEKDSGELYIEVTTPLSKDMKF